MTDLQTEIFKMDGSPADLAKIDAAAAIIRRGGLVAIPTETVYGLGADAANVTAVRRIFEVKGRPQDNPLIIHVAGVDELTRWCRDIPDSAYALAAAYWPGPVTMVLKRRDSVPDAVSAGLDTVAVRCPANAVTRELIRRSGTTIAAPSANLSGKPSTTTPEHVEHDLLGKIEAIIEDGPCAVGVESTIIDLCSQPPKLLRPGGLTLERLEAVLGPVELDGAVYRPLGEGERPRAPGMKYRHYSPQAPVVILSGDARRAADYVREHRADGTAVLCFTGEGKRFEADEVLEYGGERDFEGLAAELFDALRQLDRPEVKLIYARCPEGSGVGLAVKNRLQKAAGYNIIEV